MSKRVLVQAGIMFFFVTACLTGTTYAWISEQRRAVVEIATISTVAREDDIVLSVEENLSPARSLPLISSDGTQFYKPVLSASSINQGNQQEPKFDVIQQVTGKSGYYNDYTLTVKLKDVSKYVSPLYVYLGPNTKMTGLQNQNVIQSARIAISTNNKNYVWSPYSNSKTYVSSLITNNGELTTSNLPDEKFISQTTFTDIKSFDRNEGHYDEVTSFSGKNPYLGVIQKATDEIKFGIKIWIEGTDPSSDYYQIINGIVSTTIEVTATSNTHYSVD